LRRSAGAVERDGLENRCGGNPTQGSNPCFSAIPNNFKHLGKRDVKKGILSHKMGCKMNNYLLIRKGTYSYQRRIASSILQNLPSISPVLRISLKTGRKSEAKALSQKLTVMFDEFAKLYFNTHEEYAEDRMMLLRFENATFLSDLTPMHINQFLKNTVMMP
jgi:hypothetical protein